MNLLTSLAQKAQKQPGKEAIVYYEKTLTYQELWQRVLGVAGGLKEMRMVENDRVMIMLANSPEFIVAYYGVIAAGGIVIPVNPIYTAKEVGIISKDCNPFAIITSSKLIPIVEESLKQNSMPARPLIIVGQETAASGNKVAFNQIVNSPLIGEDSLEQDLEKVVEFLYTSGTTGTPKGAMLTHNNLFSNTKTFAEITEMSAEDRALLVAPAYHAAAQTCVMNNALYVGATLVVHDGWQGTDSILKSFEEDKITFFFGPPTMYNFLVNSTKLTEYDISSLRVAFTGAASLPVEVFRRFQKLFGFENMEGYGLSETSPVVTTNPLRGTKKIGSIGVAIPGVEVRIFNENDEEVPRGEIGEIVTRGPHVMKGYYNHPKETAQTMKNGWFHTGDMAYMDEDGYIFIIDRKKDIIIRGGLNIYPREIEEVLYTHPAVLETAVIGVPDEVMGEEVKAFIALKEGKQLSVEEVREYCKTELARYKIPKFIEFVSGLPKTTTGKVLKRELRKLGG